MMQSFLDYQSMRGFSSATVKRRRWTLTAVQRHTGRTLCDLDTIHIESFIGQLPTAATRSAILSDLRMFYRWGMRRRALSFDPTIDIDPVKVPKRNPTPLSPENLRRAIAHADGDLRLMVMLGAYAGLRVSEKAALTSENVHIPSHLVVRNGKGGKDRYVPLHPALIEHLGGRRGLIIGGSAGSVSEAIRGHFRSLGIPNRPHDLRATFGTEAARVARGNLKLVGGLMGHESSVTTERYVVCREDGAQVVADMFPDDPTPSAA